MSNQCLICCGDSETLYHDDCAIKLFGTYEIPQLDFDQDQISKHAKQLVSDRLAIPGVQQKLSVQLKSIEANSRVTLVGALGGDFILKPPTDEYPFMPEVEHVTMLLAKTFGIEVAEFGLVKANDDKLAYITKRFDRQNNKKTAVEDLCQLSNLLTKDKYRSSMERVGKVLRFYATNPGDVALKYFELVLFSFITGNADMHLKNFSLITQHPNNITLAPAYDLVSTRMLIPEHYDSEEMAMPINGKKHNLTFKDFKKLSEYLQIPEKVFENAIKKVLACQSSFDDVIEQSFLPQEMKNNFVGLVEKRVSCF